MNQRPAAPEFAMSFSQEAVFLEQREGTRWRPLGQALFSGRGMTATLNALRDQAGAAADDLDTVLVIPDDQILYTSMTVPAGTDIPVAIGRTLEAMTPYRAGELTFDWCPAVNGDIETLRVAAVARRTLEEAEDFARSQGFRPSGFTARPGDDRFDGQPDFGTSRLAQSSFGRPPFSQPDLTQARINDPAIPVAAPAPTASPVVSRIAPHYYIAALTEARIPQKPEFAEQADIGDAAISTPVADPPQTATPAVIRHGDRQRAVAAPSPMSPRAEAIHARAKDARARRPAAAQQEQAPAPSLLQRLGSLNPGRLPAMLGGLAVALVLVLALFGRSPAPEQIPQPEPQQAADPAIAQPEPERLASDLPAAPEIPAISSTEPIETETETAEAVTPEAVLPETTVPDESTAMAPSPDQSETAMAPAATPDLPSTQIADTETVLPEPAAPAAVVEAPATETADEIASPPPPVPQTPRPQGDDALSRALSEAINGNNAAQAAPAIGTTTMAPTPADVPATAPVAGTLPAATGSAAPRLASSARPPRATPSQAGTPARPDSSPAVPANPLPFEQRTQQEPPRVTATRPPNRPTAANSPPAVIAPAAATPVRTTPASTSPRPPARPGNLTYLEQGSVSESDQPTRLTRAEQEFLMDLLRDLRTAQAGQGGLSEAERGALIRLADARPVRKPIAVGATSQKAVQDALAAAVADSAPRPALRSNGADAAPVASGQSSSLASSSRPHSKPGGTAAAAAPAGGDPRAASASLSNAAVEDAIAAAVASSSVMPGAVALTALSSSALPPRRTPGTSQTGNTAANTPTAPTAPTADDLRAAAEAQQQAALADQLRQDEELQAQAEARARARAATDAQAEAQARAQAEARARAQAEAEARAAASRQQSYTPPEAEDEPDAGPVPDGRISTTAAATATIKEGIQINRTQIIGTIGAGKASRALVRLSNGRVLTLRLGDKINGGVITAIGDSRITFVKGGREQQLAVLNGK